MTTLPQTTPMRVSPPGGRALAIPGAMPVLGQPQQPAIGMSGNDMVRVLRANAWLEANHPRYTSTGMFRIMPPADFPHVGTIPGSGNNAENIDLEAHEQSA